MPRWPGCRKSLLIEQWPAADRQAWEEACRPGHRFRKGGAASHLREISQRDTALRYGMFLGFLDRKGILDRGAEAGTQTTPANVALFIAELQTHVRAATVHNCIYKLRRASELLAPHLQFGWLLEIQKEIALSIQPISKYDRLVLTDKLLEAGLALIIEAENTTRTPFRRAIAVRNGAMIALLALCPIRRKNFVALELGSTFRNWVRPARMPSASPGKMYPGRGKIRSLAGITSLIEFATYMQPTIGSPRPVSSK